MKMCVFNNISIHRKVKRSAGGLASSALSVLGKVLNEVPVGSIVNSATDALPVELNTPDYQYFGVGTKFAKRLAR